MKISLVFFLVLIFSCAGKKNAEGKDAASTPIIAAASSTSPSNISPTTIEDSTIAYAATGKEHKMLSTWSGKWVGEISFHPTADQPFQKGSSTIFNKMVMGGRYQLCTEKGSMGSNQFEGMNILGFDNMKKQFISTWIDNQGTGIMILQGPWNETTKTINLTGVQTDAKTGKEKNIHETLRIIDKDRQVLELFEPDVDGKDFKTLEILYTRKSY